LITFNSQELRTAIKLLDALVTNKETQVTLTVAKGTVTFQCAEAGVFVTFENGNADSTSGGYTVTLTELRVALGALLNEYEGVSVSECTLDVSARQALVRKVDKDGNTVLEFRHSFNCEKAGDVSDTLLHNFVDLSKPNDLTEVDVSALKAGLKAALADVVDFVRVSGTSTEWVCGKRSGVYHWESEDGGTVKDGLIVSANAATAVAKSLVLVDNVWTDVGSDTDISLQAGGCQVDVRLSEVVDSSRAALELSANLLTQAAELDKLTLNVANLLFWAGLDADVATEIKVVNGVYKHIAGQITLSNGGSYSLAVSDLKSLGDSAQVSVLTAKSDRYVYLASDNLEILLPVGGAA
jgi:hypothetical protein